MLAILLGVYQQNWLREELSCYFSYDKYPPAWPWQLENQVVPLILGDMRQTSDITQTVAFTKCLFQWN